jgi:hypothetical protein
VREPSVVIGSSARRVATPRLPALSFGEQPDASHSEKQTGDTRYRRQPEMGAAHAERADEEQRDSDRGERSDDRRRT